MHKKIPNIFTFISNFKKEEILELNNNVGIILRNFEEKLTINKILDLRRYCKSNNRKLYLANNVKLAINLNFDGVYISAFNKNLNQRKFNIRKNFLYLGSAHNLKELKIKEKTIDGAKGQYIKTGSICGNEGMKKDRIIKV